jgi:hypothetical protein
MWQAECTGTDPGKEPGDTLAPRSRDQLDQRCRAYPQEGERRSPHVQEITEAVTGGFAPQYVFAPRLVGRLACGELAIEPVLGAARVAQVRHGTRVEPGITSDRDRSFDEGFVHVTWRDEHGPGRATGRYPAHRSFEVRMPDLADRLLVRRGIDQAAWLKQEITDATARLIAAHLHTGQPSALHRFMVDGSIGESLYDELEAVARHRLYAREWVGVLTRYCLARQDTGPITSWTRHAMNEAEARAGALLTAAGVNVDELHDRLKADTGNGAARPKRHQDLLSRKNMKTATAAQLIDAAFTLGLVAGGSGASSRGGRYLIRKPGPHEAA